MKLDKAATTKDFLAVQTEEKKHTDPKLNRGAKRRKEQVFMSNANVPILLATVGGSHQPIVTAIRELRPSFVCFLCTDRDPATGVPGSRVQIEGRGNVIKAQVNDDKPTLPNIPTQCGLAPAQYEVRVVPADDLDSVVAEVIQAIATLQERYPDAHLVADYTGGTKTMTAGLVLAALEHRNIELRLVTGTRGDLKKVSDGTQYGLPVRVERIRLRRELGSGLVLWRHHEYGAAAEAIGRIVPPRDPATRGDWEIARELSRAFDAWDRFDHHAAREILLRFRPRIGARAGLLLTFADLLCGDAADRRTEPARLLDLWRNAERRATQARYDDAVARLYRLLEWTAQWLLRTRAGIDTANVAETQLAPGMSLAPNARGERTAGLSAAWTLIAHHLGGDWAEFARGEAAALLDHLKVRNTSILAHGFTPISHEQWHRFHDWLHATFEPRLLQAAKEAGVAIAPQLPVDPPWHED